MRTVCCHGFGYDATGDGAANQAFAAMLGRPIEWLEWYSAPIGFWGWMRAVLAGHWNQYNYAYGDLSVRAAGLLGNLIGAGPVDIVAHSLGSKLPFDLLKIAPTIPISRILLLDAALLQRDAPQVLPIGVEVLNIVVRGDHVLEDLGAVFNGECFGPCLGQSGLGRRMAGWTDLVLDDPLTAERAALAKGWQIGTAATVTSPAALLDAFGGHFAAYERKPNWDLYRAFLDREDLSAITS